MPTHQREHDTNTSADGNNAPALTKTDDNVHTESGLFMQKCIAVLVILACCGFFALMVVWPAVNAFRGLFGY